MNHRQTHIGGLGSIEDGSFSVSSIYDEGCLCNLLRVFPPAIQSPHVRTSRFDLFSFHLPQSPITRSPHLNPVLVLPSSP
jgi:hypothetical protein